jgi:hypothetical protein
MKIPDNNYYAKIRKAIKRVVDYLEYDEERDYEQYNRPPKNHIWHSVKLLKEAIR